MNGLLTKTLYSLVALDFFKKKIDEPPIQVPAPESSTEPEPGDRQEDLNRRKSYALADPDDVIHQIQDCSRSLQQSCEKVEKNFLGIGERLQTVHGQAGNLTQKASSAVAQMGTDSAGNVLSRVTQSAGEALERMKQKQTRLQDNLVGVVAMGDQLKKLRQMGDELISISRFLKMVGINISIESSRTEDAEEIFVALAKEIRELAIAVSQVACSFSSDTNRVHTHLAAMHQEMHTKLDHFRQLAETAKNSIEQATPNVQAIINRSVDALVHVGEDAQAISQSVANIVMSLQIHDNVSQRVNHIVEALADDEQLRGPQPSGDGPVDDGQPASAVLGANLALQIAQLEQVVSDIEDAYQVGARAFEKISRTIESIALNMTCVGTDQSSGIADDPASSSSVDALKNTLEEINAMIGRGNGTVHELQGITQSATTIVSQIEQHMDKVREVNFDIHLKSLNAMFKSMRLGNKGKAIDALVQEMKAVANQSDTFVGQVAAISGTISGAANALEEKFDLSSDKDSPISKENSCGLDTDIEHFSAACTIFKQSTEETVTLGHHLSELIEKTATELIFVKTFARDLAVQLEQLKDLHRQVAPDGETDHSHLSLNKVQIAGSYTMQQERDIHLQILNQAACSEDDDAATSQDPAPESDAEACEAFDDNIELF